MYRFKKSLVALTGVLTLVVIVTVSMPHIGRGASGANAPTTQTQNVKVVNAPSEPVPIQGNVAPVTGALWNVAVSGTPNVAVSNFPETSNVTITGTPSVGLDAANNTVKIDSSTPVSVRDADNPVRQPFHAFGTLVMPFGQVQVLQPITIVPVGKILIIEDVSALGLMSGDDRLLYAELTGPAASLYLPVTDQGIDWQGRRVFVASQHARLSFTEGMHVQFFVERNPATGQEGVNFSLFGYYVDAP